MENSYTEILEHYPSIITLEQFYRICHISKRKAKWLLENGVVPCQDSGKKTHRFKIQTINIVLYLQQLAQDPNHLQYPAGLFSSRYNTPRKVLCNPITLSNANDFKSYLNRIWHLSPDLLFNSNIHTITGYNLGTISHWVSSGQMKSIIVVSKRVIAKEWLIDFMVDYSITHPSYLSVKHKAMIADFTSSRV